MVCSEWCAAGHRLAMAAAFERARAALDRRTPLSSTMENVLYRCGSSADLLLETVVNFTLNLEPLNLFCSTRLMDPSYVLDAELMSRPLLTALQQGAARCARCSPLGRLLIQSVAQSGNSVEGFVPISDICGTMVAGSDVDLMLQLGPVYWQETDAVCGGSQEAATGTGVAHSPTCADSGQQDDEAVPRLRVVPTENPGFVMLYQVKQKQCTHPDEHLFSGDSVRQLNQRFWWGFSEGKMIMTSSGPATSFGQQRQGILNDGADMMPCLRANWWPSEEFFQRKRARDWPPAAVRDDIRQFGIHLVPVGAKGSSTELDEWRLSFSRPEVVVTWYLLPTQSRSLAALNMCKSALGPEGKPVQSYYMKTALFWLCQDSDVKQWTSIKQGMLMIIDFLERAIDARYLGCFFWSKINLFRESTPAELAAMQHTLSLLRQNMTRLLAHELSLVIEAHLAPNIIHDDEPIQHMSERQLRVCLARALVVYGALLGMEGSSSYTSHRQYLLIQAFLRASAVTELALALHDHRPQNCLFLALTVAPADVMARCRLTSLDDVMFSWDAAPLFELLTPEDLEMILCDPTAVDAWLKDKHKLPTGLSSPRARADLLLNPSLLKEALRESAPLVWEQLQCVFQRAREDLSGTIAPISFAEARRKNLKMCDRSNSLAVFESQGTQSALCQCRQFREKTQQFLDDPQTCDEYDRLYRRLPDPWRLRQFVFTDSQ